MEKCPLTKKKGENRQTRRKGPVKPDALYIVGRWRMNHNPPGEGEIPQKNQEKSWKFLKKGIDFMENLRYNWTVHEHNTEQEV